MTFNYNSTELKFSSSVVLSKSISESDFIARYGNRKVNLVVNNGEHRTYVMNDVIDERLVFNLLVYFFNGSLRMINIVPKELVDAKLFSQNLINETVEKVCIDTFGSLSQTFENGRVECAFDPKNYTWGITILMSNP